MKFHEKDSKTKLYSKGIIITLILLACAISAAFLIKGCVKKPKTSMILSRADVSKYDILVEDWNRAVVNAKLNKFFYLPDTNPEKVISKLNAITESFYQCSDRQLKSELNRVTDSEKHSIFSFYADFLGSYCSSTKLKFNSNQSSSDIRSLIKQITKQDRINTKTLLIIASMNDPCFFIEAYRNDLYDKGMSRNIQSCKDLRVDKSKYPLLFSLINKEW